NAAIRAVSDGSYDAEAEAVFVRDQMHFMDLAAISTPEPWLRWQEAVRNSQWPEWVKLTLEGVGEKELAWVKRSSSWASNVSQEQWEGFAEHLKKARDLLAKANRLRPDRPEAAASMITVAMGESVDLTEIRDWFDRSVSAQFDYGPAYHSFAWALRPRCGGSYDLMLAFGKVCGETRRFETMVPSRLMTVCISINEEVNNVRQVFRHPAIREDVVAIAKGYLAAAAAAPPQTRHLRISNAALCAWLADDDPLAATCLKEAGAQLHPATVRYLNEMLLHESLMRAEIAADTGAYGEAVRAAANPPKEATMETVAESLQKIDDKELSPEALAYVQEGRELLSFKKSLATGDWVPLIARAGLTNFNQAGGGRWQAEPDGSLVATGTDTKWSALLWRMPVEEDVEVRAEVSYEIPKVEIAKNGYGVGAFLRWTPEGRARFMTFHQYSGQEVAHIYQNDSKEGSPLVRVKFEPVNHLRAWVIDRKLNFEVNGRRAGQITQDKIGLDSDAGQVGVVTFMLPAGAKARIRNLAVRKVDAKILAAESKRAPAAAAPVAAVAGGSKSNIPWKIIIFAAVIIAAFLVHRFVKAKEA
ncbi:MAG TPA: hypothetical protein VD994_16125, partial [Prosthecobacter sp.]|nr:hypothetical protein [Prosthecobacter sp.]